MLYLLIAQVANGAFMCVTDLYIIFKIAAFYIQSYIFVSISKRHSLQYKLIHFFYAEEIFIFIIIQEIFFNLHIGKHEPGHLNACTQVIECGYDVFL